MDKQLQGTEAPLNHNSPLNVEYSGPTGHPEKELLGSQAPISNRPIGLQEFDKNTLNGEIDTLGSHAPLNFKPMHGWQSSPSPAVSDRAVKQSK